MSPPSSKWALLSLAALVAGLTAGCGGGSRDAMEKRLAELREDITRLQNSQDRIAERMMAMEIQRQQDGARAAAPAPATSARPVERPPLKVIRLEPGQPGGPAAPTETAPVAEPEDDDKGDRPVIKLRGKQGQLDTSTPRALGAALSQDGWAPAARGT